MTEHNIISVSGGKDSTALLLLAIERQPDNLQAVFADTGHEHPQTYDYVRYLEQATGVPIRWVQADFAADLARKAEYIRANWKPDLMAERPGTEGRWEWRGVANDDGEGVPFPPPLPSNPYLPQSSPVWRWVPKTDPIPGMTDAEADDKIARACELLVPTGIPFLDLCLWKGRFPSTRARFCSEELKRNPIIEQVQMPLLDAGGKVISWQGVRADESPSRALLKELECVGAWPDSGGELWNYRPILQWTAQDCFDMHRRHGIEHNPLYEQGMGRVGCMPCIHARKDELLEISRRFPDEIERVAEWERLVSIASKRGCSTFFEADTIPGNSREMHKIRHDTHGIWSAVQWAKTGRGGMQLDMLRADNDNALLCTSIYGLCE